MREQFWQEVARGMGMDKRIGSKFLHAGPGYGGSCFPKDTLALVRTAQDHGVSLRLVESVVAVNDARKAAMARKVVRACGGSVKGRTVAVLGLTFKPNTDDMRESPAIAIIDALQRAGARIQAHDPAGVEQAKRVLSGVSYAPTPYAAADGADVAVLVTEWDAYRALDLARLKGLMRQAVMVDLRNVYRAEEMTRHGFEYVRVGRMPGRGSDAGRASRTVMTPSGAASGPAAP